MIRWWLSLGVMALGSGASVACSSGVDGDAGSVSAVKQSIVNGTPTNDPKYDAVGATMLKGARWGYQDWNCSGTLIAPQVFLTAKHCISLLALGVFPDLNAFVEFGPNAYAPVQKAQIKTFLTAPPSPNHPGLLTNGGRDVAVVYLADPPRGIIPAKLGKFEPSMLGTRFEIVGYGWTEAYNLGLKSVGGATARALAGDWYPLLFNHDRAAFDRWYWSDSALASLTREEERLWWSSGLYQLEPGYELLAGGAPGDAVSCWGDSGGPLLKGTSAQDLTVYGVSFAGEGTYSSICGLGGGYLVLNDEMLEWVQQAVELAPLMLAD